MQPKDLLGKKLLFVTAHPDDESFLAAGTIYENHFAHGKSAIICATYGEKGKAHIAKPMTARQLRSARKVELEKVSKFLKVDKLFHLGLPDGELKNYKPQLRTKILDVIKQWQPDFVVSFCKDGISGHLDHIAIGNIAQKLARRLKIPFVAFAPSPAHIEHFETTVKRRRSFGVYRRTIKFKNHTFKIKTDPKVKKSALNMHKTQQLFKHLNKKLIREILNADYFRIP